MLTNMICQKIDVCKHLPGFIFSIYDFAEITESLTLSYIEGKAGKWSIALGKSHSLVSDQILIVNFICWQLHKLIQ